MTAHDIGAIHCVIADPSETDVEQWRVGRRLADGSFEELKPSPFIGYDWTGQPSWYADSAKGPYALEIWLPEQERPYVVFDSRE